MSLNGVHVAFGHALDEGVVDGGAFLRAWTTSSETMDTAGTAAVTAPPRRGNRNPTISIVASVPIFYAIGPNPDASAGSAARDYLKANDPIDRYVKPGDKVAWIEA